MGKCRPNDRYDQYSSFLFTDIHVFKWFLVKYNLNEFYYVLQETIIWEKNFLPTFIIMSLLKNFTRHLILALNNSL